MTHPTLRPAALCLLAALALAGRSLGQETVRWRNDYNAARREAAAAGKPLFLDFGTVRCVYCRQMDATTFRDPATVRTINENFVPVKLDGDAQPELVRALRIKSYPTMVVARPDGKILSILEGAMGPTRLGTHLARGVAAATPDWMARDYREAVKAMKSGDYARAVALLAGVVKDRKSRPVQVKARETLRRIESEAAVRLARAKRLDDSGLPDQAADTLRQLTQRYAGTQAADDASRLLAGIAGRPGAVEGRRSRRAADVLASARDAYRSGRFLCCLDHCDTLTKSYKGTPQASQAADLAAKIKADPEQIAAACERLDERLSGMYLTAARAWQKRGDADRAREFFQRVVKLSPKSAAGQTAQLALTQIDRATAMRNR